MAEQQKIEAGDVVRHKPTGQRWTVFGVDSVHGLLLPMGWPQQLENLADCELIEKGETKLTSDELRIRIEGFGRRFDDDREEDARMDREWAL